jgi:putative selenate reductase molybdopterin-binding subunit
MKVQFTLNGTLLELECSPDETLLKVLRRAGAWSVKHGCETGECGACSILLDGKLQPSCLLLAPQAEGHSIVTVEGLSIGQELHAIQQAFADTGAIQCGYCTPAMVLATKDLLDREEFPTEAQAREALSGVLCRCTGYSKPVEAMLRAAALLRGEDVPPIENEGIPFNIEFDSGRESNQDLPTLVSPGVDQVVQTRADAKLVVGRATKTDVVAHPKVKVDASKLVKGKPVFTDDIDMPGMLHAALLTSPYAHARIRQIDVSEARALPGVHAVLTYKDVPRVLYASGGQSYPNPLPYDQVSLDSKVRFVGDRVAIVAAETPEIARQALDLIDVEYETLPAVFDPEEAMLPGAPIIHDEDDAIGIENPNRNVASRIDVAFGDVSAGQSEASHIFERVYQVQQVQQTPIEPHVCVTYWDEDDRLVIRTATQVPFHVRRMVAPLIRLPMRRIRVIKPRIGGGFGGKQEMLIEDLCAHLTLATGRPVRFEFSRELEFTSARSRHAQKIFFRAGVRSDKTLSFLDMHVIENTGAYGTHGLTVCSVTGLRGLGTYRCPNLHFVGDIVYTNRPVPGAFRGYGAPQGEFALESLMEEIAIELSIDPLEFKMRNVVQIGDPILITAALGEGEAMSGGDVKPQIVTTSALPGCVEQAGISIEWERRNDPTWHNDLRRPYIRRGLGFAIAMHGTAIPGLDMGAASIKLNDDGSFNILVGATDLGTGSDTVLAQIAAETLGVPLEDVIIYSSDTDFTPFDTGAYASSTTFISGGAVLRAAEKIRQQIFERAALMLHTDTSGMVLENRQVVAPDGRSITLADVALHSLHVKDQRQIMATASHMSRISPPPFGAQYAEVEVDIETGQVTVNKLVMAVDCGTAINPAGATGQIEGGLVQALGYAVCEEMVYDDQGRLLPKRFGDYRIFQADEVPAIKAILVPTYEPSGPYGAKAVAEIPMDAVAPAVASAVFNAIGVRIRELPLTPEKVWLALQVQNPGTSSSAS